MYLELEAYSESSIVMEVIGEFQIFFRKRFYKHKKNKKSVKTLNARQFSLLRVKRIKSIKR